MTSSIAFVLNGKPVKLDARSIDLNGTTLSQWLRLNGHVGTKEGCAEGDCGACTVLVSMTDATGAPVWRSMCACIALVPQLDGRSVVTAEGLAGGGIPHPVQAAMAANYGSQCGYCTPGFVCSMAEGYARPSLGADDAAGIADQLSGNLCRCTGYRPIREAMAEALQARDHHPQRDAELVRIGVPKPSPAATHINEEGSFWAPTTVAELLSLRADHPNAVVVGGATELGVWLRKRGQREAALLSTDRVTEMQDCHVAEDGALHIGGATTITQLEEVIAGQPSFAALAKMIAVFASRQTRNRATVAGNLVTASPIGDLAPVLLAADASLTLSSVRGHRSVALSGFFTGYRTTVLAADELVTAIQVPRPTGVWSSWKVSKRREMDISTVSASFHWTLVNDLIATARLAFGGVAATPVRVSDAEAVLVGCRIDDPTVIDRVDAALQGALQPLDDFRGTAEYRRSLVRGLFAKAWRGELSDPQDGPIDAIITPSTRIADPSRQLDHESAHLHANGGARYVDDIAARRSCLEMWPVRSKVAHGRIMRIDADVARAMPGVHAVITAADIPGDNNVGPVRHDEPLLPASEVMFFGQPLAIVVADTMLQAQRAAAAVVIAVEAQPAILSIDAARAANSFHTGAGVAGNNHTHAMRKGDVSAALAQAPHRLQGSLSIGGQEHFYLESQAAMADVNETGDIQVWSSTQHPSEVQAMVAHVLHVARHRVVVQAPRMGGGFGGKETQAAPWAALCALAALQLHDRGIHRAVRIQLDRDVDMEVTGKRHPFVADYEVGFTDDGTITALRCEMFSDGGHALDLSESIHDRAMFHLDNCYNIEAMEVTGRVCKTHVVSHTAFRGFGGPQGVVVMEDVVAKVAAATGVDAALVRSRNFYPAHGANTHYGQPVDDFRVPGMWQQLQHSADVELRQEAVRVFNDHHPHVKRGLAMTPVKFGISFTASFLNQAGAWVLIYRDGSIQVNHGGTEMGQGLHTKMMGIVMRELGVSAHVVRMMTTATDKVPNTSATAASSGADLNGAAVLAAITELRLRLAPVAAQLLESKVGRPVSAHDVRFAADEVRLPLAASSPSVPFATVVEAAYLRGISLAADGFYRTPDIFYDRVRGDGKPFHYFAYGVCCAEVELDGHTGMKRVRRVDIVHDVGDSLHPHIDRGQIEGAFVQGMGWLTSEELSWRDDGRLQTHSASTYAIPTIGDTPADFRVALWDQHATQPGVVHGSKAVGEPPLMLAIAVREALRAAVAAFDGDVNLPSPLTHEVLRMAVAGSMRRRGA